MDALVIGCGYVGMRVAKHLVAQGHRVFGIRRNITEIEEFEDANIQALGIDITDPSQLAKIPSSIQWAVNAVSSSRRGPEVYREIYVDATKSLTSYLQKNTNLEHYLHISSTSVYGQTDGSWITEDAERQPSTETSRILVEAEDFLQSSYQASHFPATITRISGIYGPDRGYLFQQYLKNEATMVGNGSRIINMIHVDDIVRAITTILASGTPGTTYNLTDSCPTTQLEFFTWLASELNGALPPQATDSELKRRKRAITNKRVSNHRLLTDLDFKLRYPSFREGYAEAVQEAQNSRVRDL